MYEFGKLVTSKTVRRELVMFGPSLITLSILAACNQSPLVTILKMHRVRAAANTDARIERWV